MSSELVGRTDWVLVLDAREDVPFRVGVAVAATVLFVLCVVSRTEQSGIPAAELFPAPMKIGKPVVAARNPTDTGGWAPLVCAGLKGAPAV